MVPEVGAFHCIDVKHICLTFKNTNHKASKGGIKLSLNSDTEVYNPLSSMQGLKRVTTLFQKYHTTSL